jgi:hypothetical protein
MARLQVIHNAADPAAGEVDIYVNGALLLDNFAFRAATPFIDVPAEVTLNIGVAPGNSSSVADTLVNIPVMLADNVSYIAIANGVLNPANFASNPDGISTGFMLFAKADAREASTVEEEVQFFVFHGSTDAPAVDVLARGVGKIIDNAPYGAMTDYLSVPAAAYVLDITPAGQNETVVATIEADLSGLAGGAAAVLASGFLSPGDNQDGEAFALIAVLPDGTVVELPVYVPMARLQVIHNAADPAAGEVDIYVNGALLLDNFAFRAATPFIDVPAEVTLNIGVAPGNSSSVTDTLVNIPVMLENSETYVAIANGVLNPDNFATNPDNRSIGFQILAKDQVREQSSTAGEVQFIVVHGATDAPTVDVVARGVATLVQNAAYGDITDYISVPAAQYLLDITLAGMPGSVVVTYDADLSGLAGGSAVILASGFLTPGNNQNGLSFSLLAVLADGTVLSLPTSVTERFTELPSNYALHANYPNPFNPTTNIVFDIPVEATVQLEVYNMLGQRIATLIGGDKIQAGSYNVTWDARDQFGMQVSTGMYIYRLTAGDFTAVRKMTLIK